MLNINEKDLLSYCQSIAGELGNDLFQHVYLIVLERKQPHPNIQGLCKRIAYNQYFNPTSEFTKLYRPKKLCAITIELELYTEKQQDYRIEILSQILEQYPKTKRDLFVKQVWLEYQSCGSISKLERETGIHKKTLYNAIHRFEKYIIDSLAQRGVNINTIGCAERKHISKAITQDE